MFNKIFYYLNNITDNTSIISKINLWSFVNIKFFKFKFSRTLFFFINTLGVLSIKSLKILHKDWIFENFFFETVKYFVLLIVVLFFL